MSVDGWSEKNVGEVCTLQRGFDLPKRLRESGEFPLVSSSGIIDTHSEAKVKGPGVATGRSGSIGKVFYIEDDFWPLNTCLYIKDFHGNDPEFICYFLKQFNLSRFSSGAGVPTLNRNTVHDEVVHVPDSIAEQKRIVSILDEAFSAIAKAKENAEKNLANARELFESYLNRVFTQQGPGWQEKNLADVAITFGRGKSRHRPRNEKSLYGGKYPFIQTGEIRKAKHYVTEFTKTYSEKGLAQSKLWPAGTLCITIAANIAETAIITFDACIPDSVIGLVPDPQKANVEFIEFQLQFFKTMLQAQGKGAAQDNINMGTFERNEFPFAPLEEQSKIVEELNKLAAETLRLETIYTQKLANLDELKQSLLQKAFTGQLTTATLDEVFA